MQMSYEIKISVRNITESIATIVAETGQLQPWTYLWKCSFFLAIPRIGQIGLIG